MKVITEAEMPHLSVSNNNITSPTVKGICINEDVKCFEKVFVDYDKVEDDIYSSSNLPRRNVKSVLMEDIPDNGIPEDLNPSTQEDLGSFGNALTGNVGDEKFLIPVSPYLHETSKPVMNDLRSLNNGYLTEHCCSSETNAEKVPFENIIARRTYFPQDFNTGFLQVDSSRHNDSIDENHDPKQHFEQVTEQNEKLTTMASPMQAKENSQIEETSNTDLLEEIKSSHSVTFTDIKSNKLDSIEGASYDIKLETRDVSSAGNESDIVKNQQKVHKPIVVTVEEPLIDGTTARSSFVRLVHDESSCPGVASLSGPLSTSDHIPYSGNISHRSDSSTTSTHSFAFPILQSEWNSSPVKMAKADRRHSWKHRWRTMLICCKF